MESEIDNGIIKSPGVTRDISETSISILLEKPYYLEAESKVDIKLWSDKYMANLKAEIVFVTQYEKSWNYSMKIIDYTNTYDEYLQMIYDIVLSGKII
jgi:hypothetical protein